MAKNNNDKTWIIALIILIVVIYGGQQGWFKSVFTIVPESSQSNTPFPKDIIIEYSSYTANIDINPNSICSGELVTGTINTNILHGLATIFIDDGTGYKFYSNANLDSNGDYSQSTRVYPLGTMRFIAVSCDNQANCKLSNVETLSVITCDTDGDGIPDEIDEDDDNDGWIDDDEEKAGTDPKDPGSYPIAESGCSATCTSAGFLSGRGPFDSGGYCNYPEVIEYLTGESGLVCCCLPEEEPQQPTFCDTLCYNIGFNEARPVNSGSECTAQETPKQQWQNGAYTNCCCSLPPTNAADCITASQRFGSTTGLWPVSSWNECASQADAYCKSINKQWVIYALIDLSQCCGVTCSQ